MEGGITEKIFGFTMAIVDFASCSLYEANRAFIQHHSFELPIVAKECRRIHQIQSAIPIAMLTIMFVGFTIYFVSFGIQSGSIADTAVRAIGGTIAGLGIIGDLALSKILSYKKESWMRSKQASEFGQNLFGEHGRSKWFCEGHQDRSFRGSALISSTLPTIENLPEVHDVNTEGKHFSLIHIYNQFANAKAIKQHFHLGNTEIANRITTFHTIVKRTQLVAKVVGFVACVALLIYGAVLVSFSVGGMSVLGSRFMIAGFTTFASMMLLAWFSDQTKHLALLGDVDINELEGIDLRLLDFLH